eukprot:8942832-Pyramimonas_sp.AAC.1
MATPDDGPPPLQGSKGPRPTSRLARNTTAKLGRLDLPPGVCVPGSRGRGPCTEATIPSQTTARCR